jgi:hypothetical protein
MLVQLGRETRGPFVVPASDGAIVDLDGHAGSVAGGRDATRYAAWAVARSRDSICAASSG